MNHKVRNTLEHFDEYLDEANVKLYKAKTPPSPVAAYNMILSHREVTNPQVYQVRVYISSERMFYNLKWKVSIGLLYEEAKYIIRELQKVPGLVQGEGPDGLMLRLDVPDA
ncbi:hypothetical protein GCM10007160_25640 [Litchfieldella qijiaojingensis]|uniref:Uncharacterized protein n=1 Tax=Litchfieldella qijiaojingensis TaxID=980347 RepID=A0ABQ2YVP0_9GAMM|nr:hypothetical protein GCM10007160_25640 [Halomonas qijiaojingensis]